MISPTHAEWRPPTVPCQVLSDPRSRKNYDYALAHPEDTLYNEYQYYYSRYEKYWKTDPKVVVLGFLAIISIIQYASRSAAYTQVTAALFLPALACGSRMQLISEAAGFCSAAVL